jgi:hypothetical protein
MVLKVASEKESGTVEVLTGVSWPFRYFRIDCASNAEHCAVFIEDESGPVETVQLLWPTLKSMYRERT